MSTIRIIYVIEDGIASLTCGVGTLARQFIVSFSSIAKRLERRNIALRLSVISIVPHRNGVGLRPDFLRETKKICAEFHGRVDLIPDLISPSGDYFNFSIWRKYNRQVNALIRDQTNQGEEALVLANDSIFAHVHGIGERVTNVWIPNSLACVHRQTYVDQKQRERWEQSAVESIRKRPRSFIGVVSPFVQNIFKKEFHFPAKKTVMLRNGFFIPKRFHHFSLQQIKQALRRRGIPLHKKIIFSFGRADEYKGLDLSLLSMKEWVRRHHDYVGVLIASRFSREKIIDRTQRKLLKILGEDQDRIKLFLGYEFELPKYLLQYPETKILLHLPRRDFCPFIPYEAQIFGHPHLCVVNSDIECFRGLIKNNDNGFLVKPELDKIILALEHLHRMRSKKLRKIILRGREDARNHFNLVDHYGGALEKMIGH